METPHTARTPSSQVTAGPSANLWQHASASELQEALRDRQAVAIDVRTPDEYGYERIEQTLNVPFDQLTSQAASFAGGQRVYVVCQAGVRAKEAANLLRQAGCKDVRVLEGGLQGWKQHGYPVRRMGGPLPIMRQVQIIAGSLALIGGLFVSLRWVAVVVGAGLVFAGVTGHCGMAMVLARLPWNKRRQSNTNDANGCVS